MKLHILGATLRNSFAQVNRRLWFFILGLAIILYTNKCNPKEIRIFKLFISSTEKSRLTDRVRDKVLQIGKEEKNILQKLQIRKAKYTGHVLSRNCLLKRVV